MENNKRKNERAVTASEQMWNWCEAGINTDVIFNVKYNDDTKTFKLHKLILMKSSSVFKSALETNPDVVILTDNEIKPSIMELALKHIYSCDCFYNLTVGDIRDLCITANKYEIVSLTEECAKYTINNLIKPENYLMLLKLRPFFLNSFYKEDFNTRLEQVLKEDTRKCILGSNGDLDIPEDDVVEILSVDNYKLDSELDIITFVLRWAATKLKLPGEYSLEDATKFRELIRPRILPLLRFLTLSKVEIITFFVRCNWLLNYEKEQILESIVSGVTTENFPTSLSSSRVNRCVLDATIFGEMKQIDINDITKGFYDLTLDRPLPEDFILLKLSNSNVVCLVTTPPAEGYKEQTRRLHFKFTFQLDSDDYSLTGLQLFTEPFLNRTRKVYHENRVIKIATLFEEPLIQLTAGQNCLVKYNSNITEIFAKPIDLKKSKVYVFTSSYLYDTRPGRFFTFKHPLCEVNFNQNANVILIEGDIGFVRALILKKK